MAHTEQTDSKNRIRAAYAATGEDADRMTALLAENGINAVKQGGSRDIYTVGGVFGVEIKVDPDDLDRARELIRGMTGDDSPAPASPRFGRRTVLSLGIAVLLLILLVFLRGLLG